MEVDADGKTTLTVWFGYGCKFERPNWSNGSATIMLHSVDPDFNDVTFTVQPDETVREEPSGKTWDRVIVREMDVGQGLYRPAEDPYPFFTWDSADYADYATVQKAVEEGEQERTILYQGKLTSSSNKVGGWTLDSEGLLTITGSGWMRGAPWQRYKEQIKRVAAGEGVRSLDTNALSDCPNLVSVTLPKGFTTAGGMLEGCTTLPELIYGENKYYIAGSVRFTKDGKTLVECYDWKTDPEYTIPTGVEVIEMTAFCGNNYLTAITVPDTVTRIENGAFAYCPNLTTVTIPNTVTDIGYRAFADSPNLTNIIYQGSAREFISATHSTEFMNSAMEGCTAKNIHFETEEDLGYTVNSLDELESVLWSLNEDWPTEVMFRVPTAQAKDYRKMIAGYYGTCTKGVNIRNVTINDTGMGDVTLIIVNIDYVDGTDILPYYLGYTDDVKEDSRELLKKAEEILDEIITDGMGDYDKVKAIHDYLVNNTEYTFDAPHGCYSAKGPILDGMGVCDGYSDAFMLLCGMCDIPTLYVYGDVQTNHGWNMVKVDGAWYQMDITWDDPLGNIDTLYYSHFLVSDSTIKKNHHGWNTEWLPQCPDDHPNRPQ